MDSAITKILLMAVAAGGAGDAATVAAPSAPFFMFKK